MKTNVYIIFFLSFTFSLFAQPEMIYQASNPRASTGFLDKVTFDDKCAIVYKEDQKNDIWILDGDEFTNLTANLSQNNFSSPIVVGNDLYFNETEEFDGEYINNLWKTDGTIAGTELIWENISISTPKINFNDKLVLGIRGGSALSEYWIIDGATRTKFFESSGYTFRFTEFQNELYFFVHNIGLFKTDGTTLGTTIVKPFNIDNFNDARITSTVIKDGELYFTGCDETHGCEVWKTDGTENGTNLVQDLVTTISNSGENVSTNPKFILLNNDIYVYNSFAIYLLDNNNATNIIDLEFFNKNGKISTGQIINNNLLFIMETPKEGKEIWKVNTSTNELELLKNIRKGGVSGLNSWSFYFQEHDGFLYFEANDGLFGDELWRTDGTLEGTKIVYDLVPRGGSAFIRDAFSYKDKLYFTNLTYNAEWNGKLALWKFDLNNFMPPNYSDYRNNEEWFTSISSGFRNELADYETDEAENSYLLFYDEGTYSSGVQFFDQDTIVDYEPEKSGKVVISKLSKDAALLWAVPIYTNEAFYEPSYSVTVDKEKNVIVAGVFRDELKIKGQTYSGDSESFFIVKFSENAEVLWVKIGFTKNFYVNEIEVNDKNEIFISGHGERFLYQEKGFSKSDKHIGLIKLDENGNYKWLYKYISNNTSSNITFTNDGNTLLATSGSGIHVRKINQNGEIIWSQGFSTNLQTDANAIGVNSLGEILVVGGYTGNLKINEFSISSPGDIWDDKNGFILRLNSFGKVISLLGNGKSLSYNDIQIDEADNYFLLGDEITAEAFAYENWERFSNNRWTTIQKFDRNGQLLKERKILKYRVNFSSNPQIRISENDKIYLSDMYSEQLDTFSNSIRDIAYYTKVAYVLSFSMNENNSTIFELTYPNVDFTVLPNPTTDFINIQSHDKNWQNYRLTIYNTNGQLLRTIEKNDNFNFHSIQISDLPKGVLIFTFDNETERISRKVLKN